MFQYAAARALAITTQQSLLLDVNDFSGYHLHQGYELHRVFAVDTPFADHRTVRQMLGSWRASRVARRVLRRSCARKLRGSHLAVEPHFHYWPGFQSLNHDCYLLGYWQSERYFSSVPDVIRKTFRFDEPPSGHNRALADEISAGQAVSLHVRRGDYVSDRKTSQIMAACTPAYYRSAIELIAKRVERPVFYVFSDDVMWAKQHLPTTHKLVFVEHNRGIESYRDMQLMSLCRHHVIANSSFSWWGAWLNHRPEKIVVAPRHWFQGPTDTSDLIPAGWHRV